MSTKKSKPEVQTEAKQKQKRRIRTPKYKSFRLQKRINPDKHIEYKPILSAPKLLWQALDMLRKNWKLFGGILLIYLLANILLVGGLNGGDLQTVKDNIKDIFTGNFSQLSSGLALFVFLITSSTSNASQDGSGYQGLLFILISLILIWTIRRAYAKSKVRIRDAFYGGVYPLIPFLLVLVVVFLQLIPFLFGTFLYNILIGGGIAAFTIEKIIAAAILLLLSVLSLYMVLSSIFALYIVTLPDMTPMKALRSARELVRYRRLQILRKLIFLPIALVLLAALIMVPLVIFATPAAPYIFFALTAVGLAIVHTYIYGLYRELIA